jgi:hypothetical protein
MKTEAADVLALAQITNPSSCQVIPRAAEVMLVR